MKPINILSHIMDRERDRQRFSMQRFYSVAERLASNATEMEKTDLIKSTRSTFMVTFNFDCSFLASTHGDHMIRVTEMSTMKEFSKLSGHKRTPWCIAFHPLKPNVLASGCLDGEVRIWDIQTSGCEIWKCDSRTAIASLAFHPFDHLVAIATGNQLVFWDWRKPEPFASEPTSEGKTVRWVKFDPKGRWLYTAVGHNDNLRTHYAYSTAGANPTPNLERRIQYLHRLRLRRLQRGEDGGRFVFNRYGHTTPTHHQEISAMARSLNRSQMRPQTAGTQAADDPANPPLPDGMDLLSPVRERGLQEAYDYVSRVDGLRLDVPSSNQESDDVLMNALSSISRLDNNDDIMGPVERPRAGTRRRSPPIHFFDESSQGSEDSSLTSLGDLSHPELTLTDPDNTTRPLPVHRRYPPLFTRRHRPPFGPSSSDEGSPPSDGTFTDMPPLSEFPMVGAIEDNRWLLDDGARSTAQQDVDNRPSLGGVQFGDFESDSPASPEEPRRRHPADPPPYPYPRVRHSAAEDLLFSEPMNEANRSRRMRIMNDAIRNIRDRSGVAGDADSNLSNPPDLSSINRRAHVLRRAAMRRPPLTPAERNSGEWEEVTIGRGPLSSRFGDNQGPSSSRIADNVRRHREMRIRAALRLRPQRMDVLAAEQLRRPMWYESRGSDDPDDLANPAHFIPTPNWEPTPVPAHPMPSYYYPATPDVSLFDRDVNRGRYTVQRWDISGGDLPDLSDSERNVVIRNVRSHSDSFFDISSDGQLLAALQVSDTNESVVVICSLCEANLGQVLYSETFGSSMVSVSMSPCCGYLLVGQGAKRGRILATPTVVAQIYKLGPRSGANGGKLELESDVYHQSGIQAPVVPMIGVNTAKWLPRPGDGIVYGTNRGDVCLYRPTFSGQFHNEFDSQGQRSMSTQTDRESSMRVGDLMEVGFHPLHRLSQAIFHL